MKTTQHLDDAKTVGGPARANEVEEYDLLILGSGAAGKLLSWTLVKKGMKAAVIERKYIGGSCPNIACLPSKNVIHSAKVASYFRRSEEFGITKDNWKIDMIAGLPYTALRDAIFTHPTMLEGLIPLFANVPAAAAAVANAQVLHA